MTIADLWTQEAALTRTWLLTAVQDRFGIPPCEELDVKWITRPHDRNHVLAMNFPGNWERHYIFADQEIHNLRSSDQVLDMIQDAAFRMTKEWLQVVCKVRV